MNEAKPLDAGRPVPPRTAADYTAKQATGPLAAANDNTDPTPPASNALLVAPYEQQAIKVWWLP